MFHRVIQIITLAQFFSWDTGYTIVRLMVAEDNGILSCYQRHRSRDRPVTSCWWRCQWKRQAARPRRRPVNTRDILTTLCQINCAKLFFSELRQIFTNFDTFSNTKMAKKMKLRKAHWFSKFPRNKIRVNWQKLHNFSGTRCAAVIRGIRHRNQGKTRRKKYLGLCRNEPIAIN